MTDRSKTPPFSGISSLFADQAVDSAAAGRMAVVLDGCADGVDINSITERIPTTNAEDLGDVVEALQAHEMGDLSGEQASQEAAAELLMCVDISQLATADAILLAEGLRHSRACGVILAMTAAQFSLFDCALFGFVLKASVA